MKNLYLYVAPFLVGFSCTNTPESGTEVVTEETPTETVSTVTAPIEETLPSKPIAKDLIANQFKEGIALKNIQLIDVRTPEEFGAGTIEGASNIDFLEADFETRIEELKKDEPVYLFCKSGGRSGQAKAILTEHGFQEVYNLIGGYSQWPY